MEYRTHDTTTVVFHYNVTDTTGVSGSPPAIQPFDIDLLLSMFWEYRLSRRIGIYGYPVLVLLGTIGNILSFVVMTRKSMIRSSTCFYMALLAVSETMLLYVGCFRRWYSYLTKLDAFVHSAAACRVLYFLTYWSMDFAAWILVAMTIERFVAIHFPFTVTKYVTVDRAKKVSVCIGIVLLGVNGHTLFTLTIDDKGYCRAYDEYIHFTDFVFPWIDASVYSFIPFIVLIIFNILIISDWRKAARRQRALRGVPQTFPGGPSSFRLTAMLLSVSLAFLVATAPKAMLIIIKPYIFNFYEGPTSVNFDLLAKYVLTSAVMRFLTYTNHAINFLLYCINGQKFRGELMRTFDVCFHRKRRRQVTTIQQTNTGDNARTSFELRRMSASYDVDLNRLGSQSQTRGVT